MNLKALLPAALLLAAPAASAQQPVAIRAGRVITGNGQAIENGTILVRNGRIEKVGGKDLEVPFDAILHEWPQGTVFSGFCLAHSSQGMDRPNENVPVAPFLDVKDSIDPVSFYFEDKLRQGVVGIGILPGNNTVIGGLGRVVAPHGMTLEEMTLAPDLGMKVAIGPRFRWSRSAQLTELREAEAKLVDELHRKGKELVEKKAADADRKKIESKTSGNSKAKKKGADEDAGEDEGGFIRFGEDFPGKDLIARKDVPEPEQGLVDLLNGDLRIWLWCPEGTDVVHGRQWAEDHGLFAKVVFVVGPAAWKAADVLAKAGRPVFLEGGLWHVERDSVTWKEKRTFVPKVLFDAGVTFAIGPVEGQMGPDRLAFQAAACVREGIPRKTALDAVTAVPAAMWGLQERMGSLREGADGTFVVLDGDPLGAATKVLEVWVRGERVYERSKDERLQKLLKGEDS